MVAICAGTRLTQDGPDTFPSDVRREMVPHRLSAPPAFPNEGHDDAPRPTHPCRSWPASCSPSPNQQRAGRGPNRERSALTRQPGPRPTAFGSCHTWAAPPSTSTGVWPSCAGHRWRTARWISTWRPATPPISWGWCSAPPRHGSPTSCSCAREPAARRKPCSTDRRSTAWASPGRSTMATAPMRWRVPRNRWVHLRVELDGHVARLFVDTATTPTLVVPRVVTSGGAGLGVWTGAFGRGAYFSNIRYTPRRRSSAGHAGTGPATGYDARLGDLRRDRGRRLHAGGASRPRPAHLAASRRRSPKGSS